MKGRHKIVLEKSATGQVKGKSKHLADLVMTVRFFYNL
jgi:hypothetical protein